MWHLSNMPFAYSSLRTRLAFWARVSMTPLLALPACDSAGGASDASVDTDGGDADGDSGKRPDAAQDASPDGSGDADVAMEDGGDVDAGEPTGNVIREVQVSDDPVIDFEFDWGRDGVHCPECNGGDGNDRLVWSDRDYNMWLAYVDPATGAFVPEDGMGVLLDTRAAFATDFGNGPEWMFSQRGSEIVYTKYFPGQEETTFSASVAYASFVDGEWQTGIVENGTKKQSPAATLDLDDEEPLVNYQDFAKRNVYWRVAHDPDSEQLLPIANQTGGGSRRWVPGTRTVIFSGSAEPDAEGKVYQQVFTYDTNTDELRQLTFDPVTKWGAFMWQAPEYDGEYLFFTIAGRKSLSIYREMSDEDGEGKSWQVFKSVPMPDRIPYIWSPEPFTYKGRSYVFFQLSSNQAANDMSTPTQIAMTGVDPDEDSFRMLTNDAKTRRVRMDPEHYITEQGPYIYYNRYVPSTAERPVINDGVWRVDTGLGAPDP